MRWSFSPGPGISLIISDFVQKGMHNVSFIFFLSFKGKIMFPKKELSQIIMFRMRRVKEKKISKSTHHFIIKTVET